MGIKIDSDTLLFRIYRFCRRCNETTHGIGYDHEPCHNDLCPMKYVVDEIGAMQINERLVNTKIDKLKNKSVSINKQNGAVSTNSNSEQRVSTKRRCPSCGSHWLSAEYCCNCGAKTVEEE